MKPDCFVIMPIQNPETEFLWEDVYKPIIEETGFKAVRIDEQEDGTSMHALIIEYLKLSPLVVADLSLARPNCYFEVGFAMGQNKFANLILCCREDHNPDSKNYDPSKNKVHFDVNTFYVIWWSKDETELFRTQLKTKIFQRKPKILELTEMENPKKPINLQNDSQQSSLVEVVNSGIKELKSWKKKN